MITRTGQSGRSSSNLASALMKKSTALFAKRCLSSINRLSHMKTRGASWYLARSSAYTCLSTFSLLETTSSGDVHISTRPFRPQCSSLACVMGLAVTITLYLPRDTR